MKRVGLAFAICLPFVAVPPATAGAADDDPLEIVTEIYSQYGEGGEHFDVPETYFTEDLLGLWNEVDAGAQGTVEEALGFPVFNDAGEDESIEMDDVRLMLLADKYVIASYVVLTEEKDAIAATKKYFQYNFEETPDGWKIRDIDWGPDRKTLRTYLTEIKAMQGMGTKN